MKSSWSDKNVINLDGVFLSLEDEMPRLLLIDDNILWTLLCSSNGSEGSTFGYFQDLSFRGVILLLFSINIYLS